MKIIAILQVNVKMKCYDKCDKKIDKILVFFITNSYNQVKVAVKIQMTWEALHNHLST